MKRVVILGFSLFASIASAEDKALVVVPFGVYQVRIERTGVVATGTWAVISDIEGSEAKYQNPGARNFSVIFCHPAGANVGECSEAFAKVDDDGYLKNSLIQYRVTRWSESEVRAEIDGACDQTELVFSGIEATKTIRAGGYGSCAVRLASPLVMKLMEPGKAGQYLREKHR